MAQSSISAPILPVITYAVVVRSMLQSYLDYVQSKGPLQSDFVVNTATHLNASANVSLLLIATIVP
jgi:hypothetical protein